MVKMVEPIYVIAKYDYSAATDSDELDIKRNEKLLLIDDSKNWWKVQNKEHQAGFVPSNYVKACKKPSFLSNIRNTLQRKKSIDHSSSSASAGTKHGVSHNDYSDNHTPQNCDLTPRVAKYAYASQQKDEITLNKGDKVVVIEKCSDGWWRGKKADSEETGWFPSNYVCLEELDLTQNTMERDSSDLSDDYIEMVVTLFGFQRTHSWELSFEKDDVLKILDKPREDPEWWKAKNDSGEIGLIPRNYVQSLNYQNTTGGESNSSISGQSHGETGSSRTPSWGLRSRFDLSGPFEDRIWYYGNVKRGECDQMMNTYAEEGDFVLRNSETSVSTK